MSSLPSLTDNTQPSLEDRLGLGGDRIIVCPASSPSGFGADASPVDVDERRALGLLAAIDSTPMFCAQRVADGLLPEGFRQINSQPPQSLVGYIDQTKLSEMILGLPLGTKLLTGDIFSFSELRDDSRIVPIEIEALVNDKANLGQFVPAEALPGRVVYSREQLLLGTPPLPAIVKVTGAAPSSGGCGVREIQNHSEMFSLLGEYPSRSSFVFEELIPFEKNMNAQFIVSSTKDRPEFLGVSEQIVDGVKFMGSLFCKDTAISPPHMKILQQVALKVVNEGYLGILGIDYLQTRDGQIKIIDINARLNGSTGLLLVANQLTRSRNAKWCSAFSFISKLVNNSNLTSYLRPFADSFTALACYPCDANDCDVNRVFGYVYGRSRDAVLQTRNALVSQSRRNSP